MNYFAQMLLTPVQPLGQQQSKRGGKGMKDTSELHKAKKVITTERYRAAMGTRWMPTRAIEDALGYGRGASFPWLQQQVDAGLMERRPAGGTFNRRKGYEWRWI